MKLTHYLNNIDVKTGASFKSGASLMVSTAFLACASLAILTACSDEIASTTPTYTVGEADNAIVLSAGISEGGAGVTTRAVDGNHDANDTYGGGHKTLAENTILRLRVDGTWLGKDEGYTLPHGTVGASNIASQTTTASVGNGVVVNNEGTATHNKITMNPQLYWDDYGTADPANIDTPDGTATTNTGGRGKGLTIYGVAVSGKALPVSNEGRTNLSTSNTSLTWQNIAWNVGKVVNGVIDQSTNGWGDYDLLTSNNIREEGDGTYKFNDAKGISGNTPSDILEFTHAMSKITFVLTAGKGFPVHSGDAKKFNEPPKVTLTSRITGDTSTEEWAQTKGTVNVETGAVNLVTEPVKASVKLHHAETNATSQVVTLDALVFPGSEFGDKSGDPATFPVIARIEADGNVYYVTSEKIREAIGNAQTAGKHGENFVTEPGKNYIIQVTVNKTEIKVTATVTNWIDVTADPVEPEINVSVDWTTTEGASSVEGFSFYRSENLNTGYNTANVTNDGYYPAEAIASKPANDATTNQWPFKSLDATPQEVHLFWPTHNTHYQFRGVWPQTSTKTDDTGTAPHVKALSDAQVIDIKNVAYVGETYPSDLMIARPEFTGADTDPLCKNSEHTQKHLYSEGICAVNGLVTMNFRYVMSQVEVRLETSEGDSPNKVKLDANTTVDIVNVYNNGYVKLGDREIGYTDTQQSQTYTLNQVTGNGNELKRHSAILPQAFIQETAGASTNTRFKITVTNDDSTTDVYYADVEPILKSDKSGKVAPNGKWESGVHYIYTLLLTKTEIKVTATITDWVTVKASDDVWF